MRITDLKVFVVGNPWKNWIFVKVYTDDGIEGLGECTGGLNTKPIVGALEELKHHFIGEDPLNITKLKDKVYKALFLGNGGAAMAGIETALWDILGKYLNVPVYTLLGGTFRESIRAYLNGWYQGERKPEFFAESAATVKAMGYTAL